jgi:cold shock CspA family protein
MQVPPEITYKGVNSIPEIDALLQKQIVRLERVCDYIVSLHVAIEKEQRRHQLGNPYRVRLDIRVPPNHELVVKRQSVLHADTRPPGKTDEETDMTDSISSRKEEPLPAVIRRTFDSARRQLEKLIERQRGETKIHPQNQITAFVDKLFREDSYGFLRSLQGEQVYFHKNSLLHQDWERLEIGTGVRYVPQVGEKGLQASSVEIVNKLGAREMHEGLHDLPIVTGARNK